MLPPDSLDGENVAVPAAEYRYQEGNDESDPKDAEIFDRQLANMRRRPTNSSDD